MKTLKKLIIILVVAIFATLGMTTAQAETKAKWQAYPNIVDVKFVMEHAPIPKRDDVLVIDARPTARKYDSGHIPGAVSIPDREFAKMTNLLPKDKSTLMIFYCGGVKCPLSHKSAHKAEKLGYTNVKVYAAGYPDWIKAGNLGSVSAQWVKKLIDEKAKVMIVDSRPTKRKYAKGHVPTAISIPTRDFDKLAADMLPGDKSTQLIFYCGGLKCPLSPKGAAKAKALGYTNVKLFQAGYPAWKKAYGSGPTASKTSMPAKAEMAKVMIETGDEPDTITFDSFRNLVKEAPTSVHLIDVRDPEEFKTGSLPTAINMTVDEVEEKVAKLPNDKPIVFICSTGARSGEAYDIVKPKRGDLKIYFLNATVEYAKDGSFKLGPPG